LCFFSVYGCILCLVRYRFVISTSVIDCLGRFSPEMTLCVEWDVKPCSTQLKLGLSIMFNRLFPQCTRLQLNCIIVSCSECISVCYSPSTPVFVAQHCTCSTKQACTRFSFLVCRIIYVSDWRAL